LKSFVVNAVVQKEISETEGSKSLKQLIRIVYKELEVAKEYCFVIDFNPNGCKWHIMLWYDGEALEDKDKFPSVCAHFCMYAACCEKLEGENAFPICTMDMALMPPEKTPNFLGEIVMKNHALKLFQNVCAMVKKAIIKLQLPEFPEGSSGKQFKKVYKLTQQLNSGSCGTVFRAMHRESRDVVAVKAIQRSKISASDDLSIMNEIFIMCLLDHPQIIKVIDFFEEPDWYLIVMELMAGGDLFDKIANRPCYNENDARKVCEKILKALNHCHLNNVAHLDLKTKNLLLATADDDMNVKIGDFGFAKRITGRKCLTEKRGTPYYIAPEIVKSKPFDERADMWSIGVIIYLLLSGRLPFMSHHVDTLFRKIKKGDYELPTKYWENVSEQAKEIVRNLLVTDPDKRWTAQQALESEWFSIPSNSLTLHDLHESSVRLRKTNLKMTFKAAVHAVQAITWVRKISSVIGKEEGEEDSSSSSDSDF